MNRKQINAQLNTKGYQKKLVIDDNKLWEHDPNAVRIKEYVEGDLHDFFDLVQDEQLFQVINDTFDIIFIGEVFHVINLQTLVYNLEYALDCLNDQGLISICINEDSIKTAKSEYQKITSRLQLLDGYDTNQKLVYIYIYIYKRKKRIPNTPPQKDDTKLRRPHSWWQKWHHE